MGPVRHRSLINWLSMAVALQLSVALVAVAARAGSDIGPRAKTEFSAGQVQNGSILAGAEIARRRGAQRSGNPSSTIPPAGGIAPAPTADSPTATAAPTSQSPTRGTPPPTAAAPVTAVPPATAAPPARTATAPAATGPAAAGDRGQPGTLVDPAGDTVADGSGKPLRDARADIVRAGAVYGPGVTFAVQVQRPTDPRTDERWAGDSTYAQWDVDTNGDSVPDFEIQYHVVDEENLGGSVSKPGDGGERVCDIHAGTYSAEGYKITVDPACLGNPASFRYRATLYYDTDPADENADVVTDTAPNGGWSVSIPRPS